jgi:hypothetical protein
MPKILLKCDYCKKTEEVETTVGQINGDYGYPDIGDWQELVIESPDETTGSLKERTFSVCSRECSDALEKSIYKACYCYEEVTLDEVADTDTSYNEDDLGAPKCGGSLSICEGCKKVVCEDHSSSEDSRYCEECYESMSAEIQERGEAEKDKAEAEKKLKQLTSMVQAAKALSDAEMIISGQTYGPELLMLLKYNALPYAGSPQYILGEYMTARKESVGITFYDWLVRAYDGMWRD